MSKPILSLKNINIGFGPKTVLDDLDINIYEHDRICLIGKNGEGKSTLLKIICDEYQPDGGKRWILPGITVGYLPQQFFQDFTTNIEEFLMADFTSDEVESKGYMVDDFCSSLGIDKSKHLNELSGGQLRRVYLAKTLILKPDLILLDEPTNHLDINTIVWLENYLKQYQGAVICISHDRIFLKNISNKIFWLDQGKVLVLDKGYSHWDEWSLRVYEQRQRELDKLSKKLVTEEQWQHGGVTARRKRNQKRLAELRALRERLQSEHINNKNKGNDIAYNNSDNFKHSKLIAQVENLSYQINGKKIIDNFNMVVAKGDKIGLVGANGSGKTTLLNLITGDLLPQSGRVKLGKNIDITYYDQKRSELDPNETMWSTLCASGDYINVSGEPMHVLTYLKNFMFDPRNARDKVSTLSGGQANRLMLAKALANPGSLLILDEPTNDLDMDTLDIIQEILFNYKGTLIIVSHDRDFLEKIITKSLIFSGNGKINEFYGSYQDYNAHEAGSNTKAVKKIVKVASISPSGGISKLSFKVKHELETLPAKIADLEASILFIEAELEQADLYTNDPQRFNDLSKELVAKKADLERLWQRWSELES